MEQIELVIRIPKNLYDTIKKHERMLTSEDFQLYEAVENGTPLPKGHGDLKDIGKLTCDCDKPYGCEKIGLCYRCIHRIVRQNDIDKLPTIVGADKGEQTNEKM